MADPGQSSVYAHRQSADRPSCAFASRLSTPLDAMRGPQARQITRSARRQYHAPMDFSSANLDRIQQQYESDGFVQLRELFDDLRMHGIERELARYIAENLPALPAGDVIWEAEILADGSRAIRNLFRIEKHSSFFAALGTDPQ